MFIVMFFKEFCVLCKKFMNDSMEIFVDDEIKFTLYGLV